MPTDEPNENGEIYVPVVDLDTGDGWDHPITAETPEEAIRKTPSSLYGRDVAVTSDYVVKHTDLDEDVSENARRRAREFEDPATGVDDEETAGVDAERVRSEAEREDEREDETTTDPPADRGRNDHD